MRCITRLSGVALMLACTLAMAEKHCEQVAVAVAPMPPYISQTPEGQWAGAYVEALEAFAEKAALKLTWVGQANLAAAEREARDGRADLWLGAPLSLDRLEQFDYLYPALAADTLVVWVKEAENRYSGWNDLRGLRGWSLSLVGAEGRFAGFAKANLQLDQRLSVEGAFNALQKAELDYVIYPHQAGARLDQALRQGLAEHALEVSLAPVHVAVSHQSACNDAWLRGQLATHLATTNAFENAKP